MSFSEDQLVKKARMLRHAHRGLPNVLKARFSPTAIWTTDPADEEPTPAPGATTTNEGVGPVVTRPTPTTTTPVVVRPTQNTSAVGVPTAIVPTTTPSIALTPGTTTNIAVVPTTSSTPSTTSTTSSTPTTTTPSSTLSTSSPTEALFTRTVSTHLPSATSLGSASSATSTSTSSSGVSTAGIVGIAAAGVVGAVVVVGLVMFFLRRKWNDRQEFDQDAFRRQSVILRDDASSLHRGNSNGRGGFGPRPPTMFERHHQNIATYANPSANMYQSSPGPYPGSGNPFNDSASYQSPSFGPGMYAPGPAMSPAPTAQYANVSPFYNPPSQSPAGSPVTMSSYGGAAYDAQGRLVRTPSTAASTTLARNNSVAHPPYPPEEADYADLTRASVTPFQAAQYEAISRQLNIPPPKPLHQVPEGEEIDEPKHAVEQNVSSSTKDIDAGPLVSPFEDPHASAAKGISANESTNAAYATPAHVDSDSLAAPEPASRVPSMPPSLPEIKMMSGTFSPVNYSFPVTPSPRKGSFDIHSGRASPKVDMPPLSPVSSSPRRAQFVDGLEARAHNGHETPVEIDYVGKDVKTTAQAAQATPEAPKAGAGKSELPTTGASKTNTPKRPETVYSDDDAYGGF